MQHPFFMNWKKQKKTAYFITNLLGFYIYTPAACYQGLRRIIFSPNFSLLSQISPINMYRMDYGI